MKTILFFFFFFITFTSISQKTDYADFPVTTNSPQALQLYHEGIQAGINVQFYDLFNNFNKALELDPDFFMVHYVFAMFNLGRPDPKPFMSLADKAVHCKSSLNESEKLLKQALLELMEDPKADVTVYGEELIKLNPKSYLAHSLLASLQINIKDYKSVNDTYQAILRLPHYPTLIFDSMGKNYMRMNQMDKAKQAFDQYMKAEPTNASAYNSMGDYYAQLEDYENAYDNFMKAYKLDSVQYKLPNKNDMKRIQYMTNY